MTHHLIAQFSSALHWNAFLYIFYKISSTLMSFFLYHRLTPQDFSTWANILSCIFLLLLWFDFGLRKSIPRFAPSFSTPTSFRLFTHALIIFQLCILFIIAPLVLYLGSIIMQHALPSWYLHISLYLHQIFYDPLFIYLAIGLFITEGLIAMLRLMFHARFWNKLFNLSSTATLILELTCNFLILNSYTQSNHIVIGILATKIICGMLLIIIVLVLLRRLSIEGMYQPHLNKPHTMPSADPQTAPYSNLRHTTPTASLPSAGPPSARPSLRAAGRHSLIMWVYTSLKSLSERNFLLPVLTYALGSGTANIFKIAQDAALIFERAVIKTIGSSDTALLAHVEMHDDPLARGFAFQKLIRKIAGLCIPLFGILLFIFVQGYLLTHDNVAFQIFLILTGTYLLEVLVSPYERMLEVKQRYFLLLCAYIPYIIIILYLFSVISLIGLLNFVLLLQGVRLVSSSLMVMMSRYYYDLRFPWAFTGTLLCIVCSSSCICVYMVNSMVTSAVAASAASTAFNYFGMR